MGFYKIWVTSGNFVVKCPNYYVFIEYSYNYIHKLMYLPNSVHAVDSSLTL